MKSTGTNDMKPNAYINVYLHYIFAVKRRKALIDPSWQVQLHKYITAIVQNKGHKMLAIGGVADHIHIFIGPHPAQSFSDFVRLVKSDSSEWVNKKGFCEDRFEWQNGYGLFSYDRKHLSSVCNYIETQEIRHRKENLQEEYERLLQEFEIDYDAQFLFADPE